MNRDRLADLLSKYDVPGPRYTSYPTAPNWSESFEARDYKRALAATGADDEPISIYVHIPFCSQLCLYCGCSVIITKEKTKAERYVDDVLAEARLVRSRIGSNKTVAQHHWGGGTPTFLPADEISRLYTGLNELFPTSDNAEVSIEVDPRVTSHEQLTTLRKLGFNRISMGIQDFDLDVQEAIHRVQSLELTRELTEHAREVGFESVNFDLVYGLPQQTIEGFGQTLEQVSQLAPDRIACYSYAHVPWLKKAQRALEKYGLPSGMQKLQLYALAVEAMLTGDYVSIGMDHFARRDDGLARAIGSGTLHRNFMGYTTRPVEDMVSLGLTSISEVDRTFSQNHKQLPEWREAIAAGRLPVHRGLRRSEEDDRRRSIILDLMCRMGFRFEEHGGRDHFDELYPDAVSGLAGMADDGLLVLGDDGVQVTETGRLFVRNASMLFDAYLKRSTEKPVFSRTV